MGCCCARQQLSKRAGGGCPCHSHRCCGGCPCTFFPSFPKFALRDASGWRVAQPTQNFILPKDADVHSLPVALPFLDFPQPQGKKQFRRCSHLPTVAIGVLPPSNPFWCSFGFAQQQPQGKSQLINSCSFHSIPWLMYKVGGEKVWKFC